MADDDRPPDASHGPDDLAPPSEDDAEGARGSEPSEPIREDPETGSTPTDPAAEETGPYGTDPMGGPAPSG